MEYTMKEAQVRCQLSRKTIRYYEAQGLIELARVNGTIVLQEQDIARLQCIAYYR